MPPEAEAVHGLSSVPRRQADLRQIAQDFLDFIADDVLIIHNASFDMAFLNAELSF
jgi:DNA polymerase III subunit epsilon